MVWRQLLNYYAPIHFHFPVISPNYYKGRRWIGGKIVHSALDSRMESEVCIILQKYQKDAPRKIELALDLYCPIVTEEVASNVLKRYHSDWKLTYSFFLWLCSTRNEVVSSPVCNSIIDFLGKMRRFDEVYRVLDEMYRRHLINEETYSILVNRYASAHKVEDAIALFKRRNDLGLETNVFAFQRLLMCLCRYKHVELAETLLQEMGCEFDLEIKTLNIVLNGWCVLNNVHEAKRFWKCILRSKCSPDMFTYGILVKALTKKGKLGTALQLYNGMWERGLNPDVVIVNCVIDALCFKKRVPEALKIFDEMAARGCSRSAATYNSLIKQLCKIRRMEKVSDLVREMETRGGDCAPNEVTFGYLLGCSRSAVEVDEVLERMKRNGCCLSSDICNLLLRLYARWDCAEKFYALWDEMNWNGMGADRRSYTIFVHWLFNKGSFGESLEIFKEMKCKGFSAEPRTEILVSSMEMEMNRRNCGGTPFNANKNMINRSLTVLNR